MATLEAKLTKIIRSKLADGDADLETDSDGFVGGHVISSEFDGKEYAERRQRVRQVFNDSVREGHLTEAELKKVSLLLTYTPEEWNVDLEEV